MSRKPVAQKIVTSVNVTEEVLWALLGAYGEVINQGGGDDDEKFLTDASFHALHDALLKAKPHVSRKFLADFIRDMILLVDMDKVQTGEGNYPDTYGMVFDLLAA